MQAQERSGRRGDMLLKREERRGNGRGGQHARGEVREDEFECGVGEDGGGLCGSVDGVGDAGAGALRCRVGRFVCG